MLRSDSLFGKKEPATSNNSPFGSSSNLNSGGNSASGAKGSNPVINSSLSQTAALATGTADGGSKLIVGPNIKLKGAEITDCDTLVVEGSVEATMNSRVIQIAVTGTFKGSAEIDIADISGNFDGNLTVRDKLVIRSTGRVSGKIRYGKFVIEEGGQITGDVQVVGARPALDRIAAPSAASADRAAPAERVAAAANAERSTSSGSATAPLPRLGT